MNVARRDMALRDFKALAEAKNNLLDAAIAK